MTLKLPLYGIVNEFVPKLAYIILSALKYIAIEVNIFKLCVESLKSVSSNDSELN